MESIHEWLTVVSVMSGRILCFIQTRLTPLQNSRTTEALHGNSGANQNKPHPSFAGSKVSRLSGTLSIPR